MPTICSDTHGKRAPFRIWESEIHVKGSLGSRFRVNCDAAEWTTNGDVMRFEGCIAQQAEIGVFSRIKHLLVSDEHVQLVDEAAVLFGGLSFELARADPQLLRYLADIGA